MEINNLNIDMAEIKKDIEFIRSALTANKEAHSTLTELITRLDDKFATKWVERAMIGLISVIVMTCLYTIIESILIK